MAPRMRAWSRVEREIFDDALAAGQDIETAARRAGRSPLDGYRHFHAICEQLGEQPVERGGGSA